MRRFVCRAARQLGQPPAEPGQGFRAWYVGLPAWVRWVICDALARHWRRWGSPNGEA